MRRTILRLFGGIVCALLTTIASGALADTPPSVWDRARDPGAAEQFDLHIAVQQRLVRMPDLEDFGRESRELKAIVLAERAAVLAILQRAGAETSKNPLLRLDLAEVYALLENHGRSAEIYKAAITEFPDHPGIDRAWLNLAFACGHLGDHVCERSSYLEVLRRETDDRVRATPTLNLAETQMHIGDLKEAIEGYREALRLAGRMPSRETAPLATWGLAVALDRAGDRLEAEKEARFALELEHSVGLRSVPPPVSSDEGRSLLRSSGVFFVPAYEVTYYEGLGAVAAAKAAPGVREAAFLWQLAERSFQTYVKAGTLKNDRWLPMAKVRLAQAQAERARAEKAAAALPPRVVPSQRIDL